MNSEIEKILDLWETSINLLSDRMKNYGDAEIEVDSQMAAAMRKEERATLAKDMAKADPAVIEARRKFNECDRLIKAGRAKIEFLHAKYDYMKLTLKIEKNIIERGA